MFVKSIPIKSTKGPLSRDLKRPPQKKDVNPSEKEQHHENHHEKHELPFFSYTFCTQSLWHRLHSSLLGLILVERITFPSLVQGDICGSISKLIFRIVQKWALVLIARNKKRGSIWSVPYATAQGAVTVTTSTKRAHQAGLSTHRLIRRRGGSRSKGLERAFRGRSSRNQPR
jgi:hypothetical protein